MFGGQRRQIALYLEEIDSFKLVCLGNPKDLEKYADLLDIAIMNLKEATFRRIERWIVVYETAKVTSLSVNPVSSMDL